MKWHLSTTHWIAINNHGVNNDAEIEAANCKSKEAIVLKSDTVWGDIFHKCACCIYWFHFLLSCNTHYAYVPFIYSCNNFTHSTLELQHAQQHVQRGCWQPAICLLQGHTHQNVIHTSCQNSDDQSRQPVLNWCATNTKDEKQFIDALWSSGSPSSFIHMHTIPGGQKKWRTTDRLSSGSNKYPSRHEDHHSRGDKHPHGSDK